LVISSVILGLLIVIIGPTIGLFVDYKYFVPILLCSANAGIAVFVYIGTIISEYNGFTKKCLNINFYCFFINLLCDIYFIFYCNLFNGVTGCLIATLLVRVISACMIYKLLLPVKSNISVFKIWNLFKNSITFSLNSSLFYLVIVLIIYLESAKLSGINFAIFNMLLNIINFACVIFIGLNISIQIFIKDKGVTAYEAVITIMKVTIVFLLLFMAIIFTFIKVSNYFIINDVLKNILNSSMSYMCVLTIISEGIFISFIAYLTSIDRHNRQNIYKIIFTYILALIMLLSDSYYYVFLYILLANILSLTVGVIMLINYHSGKTAILK